MFYGNKLIKSDKPTPDATDDSNFHISLQLNLRQKEHMACLEDTIFPISIFNIKQSGNSHNAMYTNNSHKIIKNYSIVSDQQRNQIPNDVIETATSKSKFNNAELTQGNVKNTILK